MGKYTRASAESTPSHGSLAPAIRLFHHRWSVPILFVLRDGERSQAQLQQRLGASRDTLAQTLRSLENAAAIERVPAGARVRFALSAGGRVLAEATVPMVEAVRATGTLRVGLKKWPFVTLTAVGRGITHYTELRDALPGITPRALSASLRDLIDAGLVERRPLPGPSPANIYVPAPAAAPLLGPLEALCRAAERFIACESERAAG
ncbi:MAG: winged helix-turn-helix transcriptional regulator [Dehalococcoidia bacterium]|nr:winged helix-turn-helix transcriptional regulator [Dehalococcoidia bacterium]